MLLLAGFYIYLLSVPRFSVSFLYCSISIPAFYGHCVFVPLHPSLPHPHAVHVSLVAPQSIGACDALVLDASASTGHVGAAFAANWSLAEWPATMTADLLAAVRARLVTASSAGDLLVTIDSALLALPTDGAPFVFALTLTNQYAYSGSARVSVRKSGAAQLPLTLSGPAFQSATRAAAFDMQASTDYAATALCGQAIASLRYNPFVRT